jgi:TRAP-type uncharacterized transport system fused permease subunit
MKEKIYIPGPAKSMYAVYLSALAVSVYTGVNNFHPFLSGWRYPWQMSIAQNLGMASIWVMVLTAVVYLYYATLGKPSRWNEPLGWFRIVLALLSVWYFLLSYAVYKPNSWLKGIGGSAMTTWKVYSVFLWIVILLHVIYLYARWAKSGRFPRLRATASPGGEEVS